ncbi:MAG: hypothetical protein JW958_08715 [Candidatus Eisenbacteria bacterium]|nr:hypothetical protein [Candidatus Eisenbacteria bacterium]
MAGKMENLLLLEARFSHLEKREAGRSRSFRRDGRELFRVEDSERVRLPLRGGDGKELLGGFPYRVETEADGLVVSLAEVKEMDRVYALIESVAARVREESDAGVAFRAPKRRLRFPSSRFLKAVLFLSALLLVASFLILSYALSREAILSDRELSVETLLNR